MAAIHHPLGGARRGLPFRRPVQSLNWWVLSGVLVVGVSAMLPVLQSSAATSEGFKTQEAQLQESKLQGDISVMEAEVSQLTSLTRIQRRATEMGLGPSDNPVYVHIDEPGPAPAKIPAEYLPRTVPTRGSPAPWWRSLVDWLPLP